MIITSVVILLGLFAGLKIGWMAPFVTLLGVGYHNFIVFETARGTGMFQRGETIGFSMFV